MAEFFEPLMTGDGLISLFTLILMEIVLGVDNIIFIAILTGYVPKKEQRKARVIGLSFALIARIILLFTISWLAHLVHPIFMIGDFGVSGRDLILFAGGIFLVIKTIKEIYHKIKISDHKEDPKARQMNLRQAIIQITLIDIVFSFDSILTAVGLSNQIVIMVLAVIVAMVVMILFAPYVSGFIEKYPTLKMLALVFLVVIGGLLIAEAFHFHVDKSYIYVAMIFSIIVEVLNIRMRKRNPVPPKLH
jgi:predicted tellurium resistance membrane protein TerC